MNDHHDVEGRVADWLEGESRGELPDWVLHATFEHTRPELQQRGLRNRLAVLRPFTRSQYEPTARRGFAMFPAMRVTVAAVLLSVIGAGMAFTITGDRDPAPSVPASESPSAASTQLLEITLQGDAIPEELAGVLFSRKTYPTDKEIQYTPSFLPPNTFIRHVESGELGIRPASATQVVRAGSTWADSQIVPAGTEALVGPGDTFIQHEVPWEEHGKDALGEMWTPGDDAVIVSIAIREQSRCCSMSHPGMDSRWYHTLTSGVPELSDAPFTIRVLRWELPVGESMTHVPTADPTLWAVDTGLVTAQPSAWAADPAKADPPVTKANTPLRAMNMYPDTEIVVQNIGQEPAVLYQLLVRAADPTPRSAASATTEVVEVGRMVKGRSRHEATLLPDGRVLMSGGGWADLEVFDPASASFESAGKMSGIRSATATPLRDGRVLLAGGGTTEAEAFDPATGLIEPVASMQDERRHHSATRLPDGRVLLAGGGTDSAEIYDAATDTFVATGDLSRAREEHVATLLSDGRVLISGGGSSAAELFDPALGTSTPSEAALMRREGHTATLLLDGRVLLTGDAADAEIYDPVTDSSTVVGPMAVPRYHHAAVLLDDGRVLLAGGLHERAHDPIGSIEVFDPAMDTFTEAGTLAVARWYPTATLLSDGSVLVAGGTTGTTAVRASEIVDLAP